LLKEDILPGGERLRPKLLVQGVGLRGGVDLNIAEIMAHGPAHFLLHLAVERLALAPGLIDLPGRFFVKIKAALALTLGQHGLHHLVAHLVLEGHQVMGRRLLPLGLVVRLLGRVLSSDFFLWNHSFLCHHCSPVKIAPQAGGPGGCPPLLFHLPLL
jgi:hypothetical protein